MAKYSAESPMSTTIFSIMLVDFHIFFQIWNHVCDIMFIDSSLKVLPLKNVAVYICVYHKYRGVTTNLYEPKQPTTNEKCSPFENAWL